MTIVVPLQPGTVLQNRYEVGRTIGHGGMGAVYTVIDRRLEATVALKQILSPTPQLRKAFEYEARLLANLYHHALPRVTNHFSEDGSDFIVMDYIEGDDLATLLSRHGAFPVSQVLTWAEQLLEVLFYLHNRRPPVIHRDIKPANIKMNEHAQLVLLDFGIAKGSAGFVTTTGQADSIIGWTKHYAPPEQFLSEGTDARSDLYATGATLYHLLCSRYPTAVNERLAAAHHGRPDPLQPVHRLNNQVPAELGELLQQMMALRALDRPASAEICLQRLRALPIEAGVDPPPPTATELPGDEHVDDRTDDHATGELASDTSVSNGDQQAAVQPRVSMPAPRYEPAARPARGSGSSTLQKRIHAEVHRTLDSYAGAWMIWCDPRGDWRPLLERVAGDDRMGGFRLLAIDEQVHGEIGGLRARQELMAAIEEGESFVLVVPVEPDRLGWLWAPALLAERSYDRPLRDQLLEWGWRPPHPHVSADEIALMARQGLQQDPAGWGGGGLEPDMPLLLEVLAGGSEPNPDEAYIVDLTIEQCGLPPYDAPQPDRWRVRALAQLLATQAHDIAPRQVSANHELVIADGRRAVALDLLRRWTDSLRLSKRLPQAIIAADMIAALAGAFADASIKHGPFLSRAAEDAIFVGTCRRLAKKSGKDLLTTLAEMYPDLARHMQGFWGDPGARLDVTQSLPWAELLRLSQAARRLLETVPARDWQTPAEAIQWYIGGGWQLDVAGDEILRNLSRSTRELLDVIEPLRKAYRDRWEQTLIQWSDRWTAAGCPTPDLPSAGAWLARLIERQQATAIVVVDALRYDLGAQLVALINQQEGTERAELQAARAPLPSITALGMGMALPIPESRLRAELAGTKWRLIDTSSGANLSIAEERRKWLTEQRIVAADAFVPFAEALRGQIPAPGRGRMRLFITDNAIDRLGHDDELELLGTHFTIERYRDLVSRLRDAEWRRILIVTDHGFIHWSGSEEKRQQPPVPDPAYRSRRTLAYAPDIEVPDPQSTAPGGQWQVLTARGASCWSAYGGLGYFHGGASLQEWIIPCIKIEWPGTARPVDVAIQPIPHILSAQPRITLNVIRSGLFVDDALSRYVLVRIVHAEEHTVLFRSDQTEINPGNEQVTVTLRQTPGATASRDAPLQIEVRDALSDEVIAQAASKLRVRLDEW
jgi:serine/threonine protein kinase